MRARLKRLKRPKSACWQTKQTNLASNSRFTLTFHPHHRHFNSRAHRGVDFHVDRTCLHYNRKHIAHNFQPIEFCCAVDLHSYIFYELTAEWYEKIICVCAISMSSWHDFALHMFCAILLIVLCNNSREEIFFLSMSFTPSGWSSRHFLIVWFPLMKCDSAINRA